jgi:hypothetical protein
MDTNLFDASEGLLKRLERMGKFSSKYTVFPFQEAGRIVAEMNEITSAIPDIETPENQDQLMLAELKRRLNGEALNLEQRLSPMHYDFSSVVSMYGIPEADIAGLRSWLEANKGKTELAIARLYETNDVQSIELGLPTDIPQVRRQAEEFATKHIQKYHRNLGKMLQDLTKVGAFLRDINAVPTNDARSYFHPLTQTLAIGIPAICFTTEDGSLQVRERDLITLYGHEGMGHALNHVITKSNGLPYFLTKDSPLTVATMESVAQHYQNVILDDLKESPETQIALGLEHKFGEIYTEAKDIAQLEEYKLKLFQYAITVLADKNLGHPQDPATIRRKIDTIREVTIDPTFPLQFVEQNRYNFDSQGNLNSALVGELRYSAQPVRRALDEFAKQGVYYDGEGRSIIDSTLLKGFWTPIGFVDNARLVAQGYRNVE